MADYYLTTTGAGTKAGTSWANAFSFAEFDTFISTLVVAGDTVYCAGGTYTASDISSTIAGTSTDMIQLIGVKAATVAEPPTGADWADGDDRPLFAFASTYNLYWNVNMILLRNIRFTGAHSGYLVLLGTYCKVYNCYIKNNHSTGGGLDVGGYSSTYDCECIAGDWALVASSYSNISYCYVHDSGHGIATGNMSSVSNCIADTIVGSGISISADSAMLIQNNTCYNCGKGLNIASTAKGNLIINNTFSDCTDGVQAAYSGVIQEAVLFDWNNYYNNTRDMSWDTGVTEDNGAKGPHDTAIDPKFTDAANGDFSLLGTSGLINAGFTMRLGVS